MYKLILIIFLINISSYAQIEDHLNPENGVYNNYDFNLNYEIKIRKVLLSKLSEYPTLRFLVIPSFTPPYVMDLVENKGKYTIVLLKCNMKVWNNENWEKIKLKEKFVEISKVDAEQLLELYNLAVSETKYPKKERKMYDGIEYHFSLSTKSGKTRSPNNKTKIGKLVTVSKDIVKLIENNNEKIEFDNEMKIKINELINEFK